MFIVSCVHHDDHFVRFVSSVVIISNCFIVVLIIYVAYLLFVHRINITEKIQTIFFLYCISIYVMFIDGIINSSISTKLAGVTVRVIVHEEKKQHCVFLDVISDVNYDELISYVSDKVHTVRSTITRKIVRDQIEVACRNVEEKL